MIRGNVLFEVEKIEQLALINRLTTHHDLRDAVEKVLVDIGESCQKTTLLCPTTNAHCCFQRDRKAPRALVLGSPPTHMDAVNVQKKSKIPKIPKFRTRVAGSRFSQPPP